ncbi:MAG: phosphatidylglycerophosphatase A [Bacteroidota bacterium]
MPKPFLPQTIASVFGIGYIPKGGGTVAALLYCIVWYFLPATYSQSFWQMIITISIISVGIWCGNIVDQIWGKDSSKVVIDEVAGMSIALLFVPHNVYYVLISLLAFRFFDILKPFGVRRMENYPKGWGVMADDVLAGIYALITSFIIIFLLEHFL